MAIISLDTSFILTINILGLDTTGGKITPSKFAWKKKSLSLSQLYNYILSFDKSKNTGISILNSTHD